MDLEKIEFGRTYRDRVTGFQGVATGTARYMNNGDQVLLESAGPGGEMRSAWVQAPRLHAVLRDEKGQPLEKIELG